MGKERGDIVNRTYAQMKEDVMKIMKEYGRMRPTKLMYKANLTSNRKDEICAELEAEGIIKREKIDKFHYEYVYCR